MPPIEIEGTWEEIAKHAPTFAGRRLRLTVLPDEEASPVKDTRPIEEVLAEMGAQVPEEEWAKLPADFSDQLDHYIYGTPKRPKGIPCRES